MECDPMNNQQYEGEEQPELLDPVVFNEQQDQCPDEPIQINSQDTWGLYWPD